VSGTGGGGRDGNGTDGADELDKLISRSQTDGVWHQDAPMDTEGLDSFLAVVINIHRNAVSHTSN
jgi:hypothetical protein